MAQLKQVHTAPWSHCPNRNVFSDRRNSLYDKSASFRCDGRLFWNTLIMTSQTHALYLPSTT